MDVIARAMIAAVLAGLGIAVGSGTAALAYPDKPVRLIVSFPPGGSSDAMARIVQPGVEKLLGQPIVIENRPGAGGMIAIDLVAKAAPDGHVIGLGGAGALGTNLGLQQKMTYDPQKDIAPVTGLASSPFILAAPAASRGKSLRDFIALAKQSDRGLAIGHGGNGTLMHLTAEMLNQMAGTKIGLVPYRGIAPVVNDLLGGHVALGVVDPPSAMSAIEAGNIATIAITSAGRFAQLPDIPTFAEFGPARLRIDRLVRHRGASRHAGGHHRQAQCGLRHHLEGSCRGQADPGARLRAHADDAARVRGVHRNGDRQMDQSRERGRAEAELSLVRISFSLV